MSKKVIILFFLTAITCSALAKSNRKNDRKDESIPVYEVTSFDYDYGSQGKAAHKSTKLRANPPPPTEGPFIRYWNNFIRSVRLPIPTITWNMTNPLATIFTEGASNLIETPVVDYDNYDDTERRRKSSTSNKRKNTKKRSKTRKRQKVEIAEVSTALEETANEGEQQIVLQPYPIGVHPAHAVYFYDANADQYYEVQRDRNSIKLNNKNKYEQGNYYDTTGSFYDKLEEENMQEAEVEQEQEQEDTIDEGEYINSTESNVVMPSNKPEVIAGNENTLVNVQLDNVINKHLEKESDEPTIEKLNEETLRNAIGSFMKDDRLNRHRQQAANAKINTKKNLKERPRIRYYFLNW